MHAPRPEQSRAALQGFHGHGGQPPLTRVETQGNLAPGSLPGLGLWLDGVACRWGRPESLDCTALSFPEFPDRWRNARLPLVAIAHAHVTDDTMSDLLDVLAWSVRCAYVDGPRGHDAMGALGPFAGRCAETLLLQVGCALSGMPR